MSYSRGLVAILLGEAKAAIIAFEEALPPGRRLRDQHLVRYGEVYLAEAHILAGNYRKGLKLLGAAGRQASREDSPLLFRMVHCRKGFLEALLGLQGRAGTASTPATSSHASRRLQGRSSTRSWWRRRTSRT